MYTTYDFSGNFDTISFPSSTCGEYVAVYPIEKVTVNENSVRSERKYPIGTLTSYTKEVTDRKGKHYIDKYKTDYKKYYSYIDAPLCDVLKELSIPNNVFKHLNKVEIWIGGQLFDTVHSKDFDRLYELYDIPKLSNNGENIIPIYFSKIGIKSLLYFTCKIYYYFNEDVRNFDTTFKIYKGLENDPDGCRKFKYSGEKTYIERDGVGGELMN
jgi:hypothetical protein